MTAYGIPQAKKALNIPISRHGKHFANDIIQHPKGRERVKRFAIRWRGKGSPLVSMGAIRVQVDSCQSSIFGLIHEFLLPLRVPQIPCCIGNKVGHLGQAPLVLCSWLHLKQRAKVWCFRKHILAARWSELLFRQLLLCHKCHFQLHLKQRAKGMMPQQQNFAAKTVRETFKTTAPQVPLMLCPQLDQKMKQRVKVWCHNNNKFC